MTNVRDWRISLIEAHPRLFDRPGNIDQTSGYPSCDEGWRELLRHYIASPGMGHYWKMRRDLFSTRFQEFVQSLDRPTERFTVGTLLGQEKISK